jgi:hypothetical protein
MIPVLQQTKTFRALYLSFYLKKIIYFFRPGWYMHADRTKPLLPTDFQLLCSWPCILDIGHQRKWAVHGKMRSEYCRKKQDSCDWGVSREERSSSGCETWWWVKCVYSIRISGDKEVLFLSQGLWESVVFTLPITHSIEKIILHCRNGSVVTNFDYYLCSRISLTQAVSHDSNSWE